MAFGDPKPGPSLTPYVVEWAVEDVDRYERLSGRKVQRVGPRNAMSVSHTVITVVLEVPRISTEAVTNELRRSPHSNPAARYLSQAAAHADDARRLDDRVTQLEVRNQTLVEWLLELSKDADETTRQRVMRDVEEATQDRLAHVRSRMAAMSRAVDERKVDVAARLLEKLPDGDW